MVRKLDGTVEGIPKTCLKCGTFYHVVGVRVGYSHGRGPPFYGLVVSYTLRCEKCNPPKPYEWRDKSWRKALYEGSSSDRDAIEDGIQFIKQILPKLPHLQEVGSVSIGGKKETVEEDKPIVQNIELVHPLFRDKSATVSVWYMPNGDIVLGGIGWIEYYEYIKADEKMVGE